MTDFDAWVPQLIAAAPIHHGASAEYIALQEQLWEHARLTQEPIPLSLHVRLGAIVMEQLKDQYRLVLYDAQHYLDGVGIIGAVYQATGSKPLWMTKFVHTHARSRLALQPIMNLLHAHLKHLRKDDSDA